MKTVVSLSPSRNVNFHWCEQPFSARLAKQFDLTYRHIAFAFAEYEPSFITARKRSLRRLCFYTCLSVILFTGGGVPTTGTPRAGTHPHRAGTSPRQVPPRAGTPTSPHACLDTVNKRKVRIPLEYILVVQLVLHYLCLNAMISLSFTYSHRMNHPLPYG